LRRKLAIVESACDALGLRLWWGATHPFSTWLEQRITPDERYLMLVNLLQEMARRLITFGLHIHVGVDSGDKAVLICDRIMRHLPTLLALSVSSPFWEGRRTGLQSHRSKVMENLPTAGLPTQMRNWSEYVWLVNHMIDTGFINTIREIWWDVRPHHNFGTVEVRVCDMPSNLADTLGLAALVQCLVKALSDEIDNGTYQSESHPMMVQQNKWRAARFGNQAKLVDTTTYQAAPVEQTVERLAKTLRPVAAELGCDNYLQHCVAMSRQPSAAQRQLDLMAETNDPCAVVRRLVEESRVTEPGPIT
jgi:carboxylate-amine ligase